MTNIESTQAIIAVVLEEVNGYSHEEAELYSKEDNGELESKILTILEEKEKENIDSGVWLAITEFAFHNESHRLIENVINAMGFSYDDCITLMQQNKCNNDVLEPIVNAVFNVEQE
nr:MAG TPA: UBA-like domain protein [Caudoviricetes sp.]